MLLPFNTELSAFSPAPKSLIMSIYERITLAVALYEWETWAMTLRVDHRPTVFEERVLTRIFGPKKFEGTEGWRTFHNESLNLYSSPNIIRNIK
jgi:hypothetical protein